MPVHHPIAPESTAPSTTRRSRVFILDDEENMVRILSKILAREGFDVVQFTDPVEAVRALDRESPDVLVTDVSMPEMDGMTVLAEATKRSPRTRVVIITGYGTIEGAIKALKVGALEYVTKPFDTADLVAKIRAAAEAAGPRAATPAPAPGSDTGATGAAGAAAAEPARTAAGAAPRADEGVAVTGVAAGRNGGGDAESELARRLLGHSPLIREVRDLILRVAPTDSPVLIRGESGTGKEVVARSIHDFSPRARRRFVPVNCAAIPESLVESELFGHEKGSFTGAVQRKLGLIEAASGGTLLLDEISELPLPTQAKLLRVLQEREIQRVGGIELIPVDIRLIAASNRPLEELIESREFRSDLFYRLNVIRIVTPTLRDRIDDITPMAEHFLTQFARRRGRGTIRITAEALAKLRAYSWPGNVRELENVIERMVILAEGDSLDVEHLPEEIAIGEERMLQSQLPRTPVPTLFRDAKEQFERRYLQDLLRKAGGSVTTASQISGISRRNLYDKIEKLNIDIEDFKRSRRGGPG